jgi:hypothetical protein
MDFNEMCAAVGLQKYPDEYPELYKEITPDDFYITDDAYICECDKRYGLFTHLLDETLEAAKLIREDEAYLMFTLLLTKALISKNTGITLPPDGEGRIKRNFAPLIAMLPSIERANISLHEHDLPEKIITDSNLSYESCVDICYNRFGYHALNQNYWDWLQNFLNCRIFRIDNFNYEMLRRPNKRMGLNPDCDYINVHIPRGTKINLDICERNCAYAKKVLTESYPDFNPIAYCCYSWLMDPHLAEHLKPNSNILSFQSFFDKFNIGGNGDAVFSFVFTKPFRSYAELPENTSLERSLKKLYMNGGMIRVWGGIHMIQS